MMSRLFVFAVVVISIVLHLIQIHGEDLEINIKVKFSDSAASSSKIISVLIKHDRNSTQTNCTLASNSTSTTQSTPLTTLSYTSAQSNSSSLGTTEATSSSAWLVNATDLWWPNETNVTTDWSTNATNDTNPWWLDWWAQMTTASSIVGNATRQD